MSDNEANEANEAATPTTLNFGWTNVIHLGLCGWSGEDLGLKGVKNHGDWVNCPAGWFRPAARKETATAVYYESADAVDVHGDGWIFTLAGRAGVGWS